MRETLDCGVLMVPPHHGWMYEWMGRHAQALGRLRLLPVHLDEKTLGGASIPASSMADIPPELLARLAIPLRRYDVCVLPVTPATVAWTRTALACARTQLHTPLLALARGLKAAAVQDLLMLGLHDFALHRACVEELRARLSRLAESMPRAETGAMTYVLPPMLAPSLGEAMVPYGAARNLVDAQGAGAAGVPGSVGSQKTLLTGAPLHGSDPAAVSFLADIGNAHGPGDTADGQGAMRRRPPGIAPNEPFRVAKSRVVGSFERDYVRTALSRHAGNVASAARASAKHRRAFWALMRKHAIDADPYRNPDADDDDAEDSWPGGPEA